VGNVVVTRREGQRLLLRLGDVEVWVSVLSAERGAARLAVLAPDEVLVLREELLTREKD
jgi:sRNA-binding carbon storage regulator CsrA